MSAPAKATGPLAGVRIIEISAQGPAPFCGMMLADQGAEVTVVHRPGAAPNPRDPLARSRRLLEADLKSPIGRDAVRRLAATADGLIEGFRPGVMERLGLGPDELLALNPRLVYGRMTGWGQDGPLAQTAGHDINYLALSGVLHALGRAGDKPTPPINLIGDFGGGGMLLAVGMLSAILNVRSGGAGQVVDCAMTDGAALLMNMIWGLRASGAWSDRRGENLLDTGAHCYETYATADGKFMALGALEPQFYGRFRDIAGLTDDPAFDAQLDQAAWPQLKARLAQVFASKTREEWSRLFDGTDACCTPVLNLDEALAHEHNRARATFVEIDGVPQAAPAPRYLLAASTLSRAAS